MLKNLMIAAVLAVATFCALSTSAQANTGLVAEKGVAWMIDNGWTGEPILFHGRPATHWKCNGIEQADHICKKAVMTTHVVQTQTSQQTTVVSGTTFTSNQLHELVQQGIRDAQINRQMAATPVVGTTTSTTSVSAGGWAKKVVTPALIAEMLKTDVDDDTWYAIMSMPKKEFVKKISFLSGKPATGKVSDFSAVIATAAPEKCTADIAKKLEVISTNLQTRSFGKCVEGDEIWSLNGTYIWSKLQHEVVVDKNNLLPKYEG